MSSSPSRTSEENSGQLTFFKPPKDENASSSSSVLHYVKNFFASKKDSKPETEDPNNFSSPTPTRPNVLDLRHRSLSSRRPKPSVPQNSGSEVELRFRSLSTILKEFPKLVKGPQGTDQDEQSESSTPDDLLSPTLSAAELRQYWMPDEQCHECYECGEKFTTFRRKHHCRICGQIFCSRCCNQLIPGNIMALPGMLRACSYCWKLVSAFSEGNAPKSVLNSFSHASSAANMDATGMEDSSLFGGTNSESMLSFGSGHPVVIGSQSIVQSESNTSLKKVNLAASTSRHDDPDTEDEFFARGQYDTLHPSTLLSPAKENFANWKTPGYIFDANPEVMLPDMLGNDIKNDLVEDSTQLHSLWRKITDERQGIEFRGHRFRLRKYSNCITGQELIDWLIRNDVASTRAQGCAIGQALYEGKWLKPVVDIGGVFQDGYILFQNGNKTSISRGSRIEIYPDHFANFPGEGEAGTVQTLTRLEPIWVQEIKCEGDNEVENEGKEDDRYHDDASESELTWSDAPNNMNEALLYSDEDKSVSERSVVSLSSFVEIDEGNDIIKYTRPSTPDKLSRSTAQESSSFSFQPDYDDSCVMNISADYLRNLIAWNGNHFGQPLAKPSQGWRESDLQSSVVESQDKRAFQWLREMYLRHNLTFLRQLLRDKGLDLSWAEILVPLAKHAAQCITPNPNVSMDVCHYFQIKKVLDGLRNGSEIVNGVVCTKNVVHKQMKTDINNPSILLLAIPLEYQRVQLKLSALDPIVRQEREFYKHLISRITARHPQVVLVQRTVSHLAQDLLLQAGITLVINVKQSVMERVARSIEADIVYSIDQLIQAKLGHCSRFYVKHHQVLVSRSHRGKAKYATKTLMYFDGCNPIYGCTAILRGRTDDITTCADMSRELSCVQGIFRFLVRAMFHARLELSYLIDQHNFGKLLKKHSSAKQMHRYRSESESTAKNHENDCSSDSFVNAVTESKKSQNIVEHLSSIVMSSDGEDLISPGDSTQRKPTPISPEYGRSDREVPTLFPSATLNLNRSRFIGSLRSTLLSVSPLVQPQLPFLFTSLGQNSSVQKYLPNTLFWSRSFETKSLKSHKLSSVVDMDRKGIIRSRSSTVESLIPQDHAWLSPPHQSFKSPYPTEADEAVPSGAASDSSFDSKEILDEVVPVSGHQKGPAVSCTTCYTQQYKHIRSEGLRSTTSDVSVQPSADPKLHTWEQKLLDMVFGTPMFLRNEKHERFVLSPEYSPNGSPSAKRKRHLVFASDLNSTRTCDVASVVKHSIGSTVDSEHFIHPLHEFVTSSLAEPASSDKVKDLLASFRAHAGLPEPLQEVPALCELDTDTCFKDGDSNNETWPEDLLPPDCMDAANHQHICALFSSYSTESPNAPYFCVQPWIVDIDFYRGNDITLGGFLERYCFRPSYHCPSTTCRRPMVEHIRSFVHGNMCMTVVLKELSKPFQQSCIMTWCWDWGTKKSSDVKTLSHDAWSMSFAKYLELNLGRLAIPDCASSQHYQKGQLKQDIFGEEWELKPSESFQYFLFRDIVAAFKCFPIHLKEVEFPSSELLDFSADTAPPTCQISGEFHEDTPTYTDFYSSVESLGERIHETFETAHECIQSSRNSKNGVETPADDILAMREKFYSDLTNSLAKEKVQFLEKLKCLQCLLNPDSSFPAAEPHLPIFDSWDENKLGIDDPPLPERLAGEISFKILNLKCELSEMVQKWNEKFADAHEKDRSSYWSSGRQTKSVGSPQLQRRQIENTGNGQYISRTEACDSSSRFGLDELAEEGNDLVSSSKAPSDHVHKVKREHTEGKLKRTSADGRSIDRTASYKRLSRTGSSVKFLVTRLLPGNSLLPTVPIPFPADEHYLLPECLTTNIVVRDAEPSSIIAYTLSSKNYKAAVVERAASVENSVGTPSENKLNVQAADNLNDTESYQLPACAEQCRVEAPPSPVVKLAVDQPAAEDSPDPSVVSGLNSDLALSADSPHIEIQFSDTATRFYCKVYFATLFENFRSKILAGSESQYLRSLSRSAKWLARGGKSGSTFHKTKDDQFILKQMSYFELQSFLEFAPKYVEYITSCIDSQKATTISKILGVYRISFRNSVTNRSLKQDVLVIENLFYRRKIGQIFDLKGSVRNRHVKESSSKEAPELSSCQGDIVLQDANLLKTMCENPIYVHEHTKHLMMNAMIRDTEFLSRNFIMDYSLLVGIDDGDRIIVGIIDFIRTFTWDKKLEMVVKWSSSRSMPTVVSPELYKNRFCEAMGRYFQVVPDRWYGMHSS